MNQVPQPAHPLATVPAGESSVRSVEGRPSLQAAAGPPLPGSFELVFAAARDLGYAQAIEDVHTVLKLAGVVTADSLIVLLKNRNGASGLVTL